MLIIYQIGDVPLFHSLRAEVGDTVNVKNGRSWRVPTVEFLGSSGDTFVGDPYRPTVDAGNLNISGEFICTDGDDAKQILKQVQSLGGMVQVPVIGFNYQECDHVDSPNCCAACNPTLDWIVTYGIITKMSYDSKYFSSKDPFEFMLSPVTIDMTIGTKWKSLNKFEWEYRIDRNLSPYSPVTSTPSNYIPFSLDGIVPKYYFYRWNTALSKYDPTFWGYKHADLVGGVGSNFVDLGAYDIFSPPQTWSAPPNSVYAFTGFTNLTSTLTMSVARNMSLFDLNERVETSSLSLTQLNTDMIAAGYGGLYASDYVITGFATPFPGFVVRDNVQLKVRPRWTYPGLYPGETGIGFNRINVECVGNPLKMAYLHEFGTY